jgi:hypothetical protein
MPVILDTWEAEIRRIEVQGQPGQIVPEIPSTITKAKCSRGLVQVAKHLLSECETLSSKPHPTKKKLRWHVK